MNVDLSRLMATEEKPGDYVGSDGLLYCGKCHTPKQMWLSFDPSTGGKKQTLVHTACKCQKEAREAERERAEHERFLQDMARRREDGISCPDGLRYTFAEDDRAQSRISDACRRYVDRWEEMRAENIGILFYGTVGTGKSFYSSCIGNALLENHVPVAATNFPRLLNLLQGTMDRQKLLDRLSIYKLLIIDDLGVERDSPYAAEQIFNIIDARASSRLPVIVTTNLTLEELEHPTSMQHARIYDRVLDMCPMSLKMVGQSRRKGDAERRKRLAQQILLE